MVTLNEVAGPSESRDQEQHHHPTPTKVRVRILTQFTKDFDLDVSQNDIFRYCGVSKQQGYHILRANEEDSSPERRSHNKVGPDPRGAKHKLQTEDLDKIEDVIQEGGFDTRVCGWMEIVMEVLPEKQGLHIQTIRAAMRQRGYYKCIACQKPFLTSRSLAQRREYLQIRRYWTLQQWRTVRFSDEVHFGQGPKRKLKVIRKRGERYHSNCIQKNMDNRKIKHKNDKRYHCWGAIGYNFKSDLVFYETSNKWGKMTYEVYFEKVLKKEVQRWLDNGDTFILEEDQDSSHGVNKDNPVRKWKEDAGLEYFFNASGSPDLAPIENIWRAEKQQINTFDHFDDDTLYKAINDAWKAISFDTINRYIDSMRQRMDSLSARNGDVTEF
jgi:hypothetical protein